MRAAVLYEFGKPQQLEDVPVPEPGPGEIVFRVEASGVCHSDVHIVNNHWPWRATLPRVLGHEGVGIVERIGEGVTGLSLGDRIGSPWIGYTCGTCYQCLRGWESLCEQQRHNGFDMDGAHAEYAKARASYVIKVPDNVPPWDAAPLLCGGVGAHKAIKWAEVRPSQLVAVFGIGGLGHLALQYAKIAGATVAAISTSDEKLRMARELGADYVFHGREEDPVSALKRLGGADVSISTSVAVRSLEQSYRCLRRGGKLVFVALPPDDCFHLPIFETVMNTYTVTGSIVGTRLDLAETFALHAAGKTKVVADIRPLDEVNQAFEDVEHGRAMGHVVFEPRPAATATAPASYERASSAVPVTASPEREAHVVSARHSAPTQAGTISADDIARLR
jgi:propanol-preferring alcohol dehydrogenase